MTGTPIVWSWNLWQDLQTMFQFRFMVYGYQAGAMIAILAGIVSYLVVLRKSSFAAHALGHVGFAGAAGAVVLATVSGWGWLAPVDGLFAFTTGAGTGISLLGQKAARRDVEIGTVLAFMLGLGVLFISLYNGYSTETYSILFGSVVAIDFQDVLITLVSGVALLAVLAVTFRPILFSSLDEEAAEAKGMPTLLLGWIFMMLLAVAISIAVQIIGVLLIFALLVTPGAVAIRLSSRPVVAICISVVVAIGAVWGGLFINFWGPSDWPPGFPICTLVFAVYVLVRGVPYLRERMRPTPARAARPSAPSALGREPASLNEAPGASPARGRP